MYIIFLLYNCYLIFLLTYFEYLLNVLISISFKKISIEEICVCKVLNFFAKYKLLNLGKTVKNS